MHVLIKKVSTKKELEKFIKFPMKLYANNPYYVPPLISEEIVTLSPLKNPVFSHAEAHYYLAYKNNEIVGRIAAIINWKEVREQGKKKVRFGWFDVIDDQEVTKLLLDKVFELGCENQLQEIEGPVGFSNLEKAGLLTFGFDKIATMVTLYNHSYYEKHLLDLGFETSNEWVEYEIDTPTVLPEKVVKFSKIVKERYGLKDLKFKNSNEIIPYVDEMFDLINKTYAHLATYVPIAQEQINYYKEKYIKIINPDFVNCIVNDEGRLVAFAITMPSYSKALQKAKGSLYPFGWIHFLKASRKNDSAAFYLIGVDPKFQNKGVTAIIFQQMFDAFHKYGIKYLETNPELIENKSIQALWEQYKPVNHKKRKSFRKDLDCQ